MLNHIEIYVRDLDRTAAFYTPFLEHLGYAVDAWSGGINYVKDGEPYLSFLPAPAEHLDAGYHRKRIGLNHLAFTAGSRAQVDEIARWVESAGFPQLYADRYPYATGPGYYALFCEDPDRIKIEVVAPPEGRGE